MFPRVTRIVALLTILSVCPMAVGEDKAALQKTKRLQLLQAFVAEFVEITPGRGRYPRSFRMGSPDGPPSEQPVHTVSFDSDFSMSKYEVPQSLYESVTGKNPSVWGGPRNAVEMMNWQEATQFCARITMQLREADLIEHEETVRLPTEAEWEYCARAGSTTPYSFGPVATQPGDRGKQASALDAYGWHTGNAAGNDPPVGALKPNAWGLYDMHGYLWEYVADAWHRDYSEAPINGGVWSRKPRGKQRVIRGGSWRDQYEFLQSTTRWAVPDHVRSDAIGFRCVKAAETNPLPPNRTPPE